MSRIPPVLAGQLEPEFASELASARLHRGGLATLLTALAGASAIVFGRRVFLSRPAAVCVDGGAADGCRLLAHELAHVAQYRRFGAAPFLGRYVGEYLRGRLGGLDHRTAYRSISFEREAEERARAFGIESPRSA